MSELNHSRFLTGILRCVQKETADSKARCSESELKRRINDAPECRSFKHALSERFVLIAEIKKKSPSLGPMNPKDVEAAPQAYDTSEIVGAISVLTNNSHFGMNVQEISKVRARTSKPILRKDFIIDEYQVYEARAWGADAILLMASVLSSERLLSLGSLATELGMDVLYESHTATEISRIPKEIAQCWGINCRKLDSSNELGRYRFSREIHRFTRRFTGKITDFSIKDEPLSLIGRLPKEAPVKVAESGINPKKILKVRQMRFNSALVGNCLLASDKGVEEMLRQFSRALASPEEVSARPQPEAYGAALHIT